MTNRMTAAFTLAMSLLGGCVATLAMAQTNNPGNPDTAGNPTHNTAVSGTIEKAPEPLLTPAQRNTIYALVSKDKSKTSAKDFSPVIGADVPPTIELYKLPDNTVTTGPGDKVYKYTMVEDKVVVVDPGRIAGD